MNPPYLHRRATLLAALGCLTAGHVGAAAGSGGFFANFRGMKLLTQEGRPLDTARWRGQIVLVNFVFTGCSTICPIQTRRLADMQRQMTPQLRKRVQLLSVSLDPLQDTPEALKVFGRRMGVDFAGWTFATGRPQDVERLSASLRLFRPGPDTRKPEDHSTALWLLDDKGEIRMRYSGNPPDVPRLLRELRELDQIEKKARNA